MDYAVCYCPQSQRILSFVSPQEKLIPINRDLRVKKIRGSTELDTIGVVLPTLNQLLYVIVIKLPTKSMVILTGEMRLDNLRRCNVNVDIEFAQFIKNIFRSINIGYKYINLTQMHDSR